MIEELTKFRQMFKIEIVTCAFKNRKSEIYSHTLTDAHNVMVQGG